MRSKGEGEESTYKNPTWFIDTPSSVAGPRAVKRWDDVTPENEMGQLQSHVESNRSQTAQLKECRLAMLSPW